METTICMSPIQHAVVWVKKARAGSLLWPVEPCPETQFEYYCHMKQLKILWTTALWGLLALSIFEEPAPCRGTFIECATCDWKLYAVSISVLPRPIAAAIAAVIYVVLLYRVWLRRRALGTAYKADGWTVSRLALAILGIFGCACFWYPPVYEVSLLCRPLIFFTSKKHLRESVGAIARSLPGFIAVLVSLFLSVLIFVVAGMVLFVDTAEGAAEFRTWSEAWAEIWILFTTANSPNVFIAAYNSNRLTFVFFFIYLLLTLYLLGSVLLANIYDSYKRVLAEQVQLFHDNQQTCINHAFDHLAELDVQDDSSERYISTSTWEQFFVAYCDPHIGGVMVGNAEDVEYNTFRGNLILKLFHDVNFEDSKGLNQAQFKAVLTVFLDRETYIPSRRKPEQPHFECWRAMLRFYNDGVTIAGVTVRWDRIMDCIIFVGGVLGLLQAISFTNNASHQTLMQSPLYWVVFGFSIFYVLSITMKISSLGFERFWFKAPIQHRFDFFNVYGLFIAELLYIFVWRIRGLERAVILLALARTLRLFVYLRPLRRLFFVIQRLIPTFSQMSILLLVVYYIFAVVGRWFFGGIIYTTNPAMAGSSFAASMFWALNFNDILSSFVTLFSLMVVNNWYIIANGFMIASGTRYAAAFFVSFFVVCNLIVLNILMALILDCTTHLTDEVEGENQPRHDGSGNFKHLQSKAAGSGAYNPQAMLREVLRADVEIDEDSEPPSPGSASPPISRRQSCRGPGGTYQAGKYGTFGNSRPSRPNFNRTQSTWVPRGQAEP